MKAIPNEQLLLQRIKNEDDDASFKLLFDAYWELLFLQALQKTKSQDLAKDLAQETFIAFWKYRKSLKQIHNLKSYLVTMLKYQFLKWIEQEKIVFDELDTAVPNDVFIDREDGFKIMEFNELYAFLMDTIDALPTRSRQIFIQNRFENKTVKELAETYNVAESTVRNHLSQANSKIQGQLENNLLSVVILSLIIV
ncbi:RNA polymerase sigma factor [Cyclobacterium qasimii]|uniref:RNA polymerase ECF-type sigma factor n=2 Tax=Cyclobacterium qasimii TaxID=1350429 RepID=S7WI26_9BACT|nr:sigma-70 family RNA polymerase sigma factor [Cyclobacterium qasimii]EPR66394.1 RNA polymerase ECF-type sigma factor [Cyclobacterium qasimii M12-11B]GEO21141.1 DNA-directed RNA polymerase sigma-70 factor [Cyclobacterium qasimii]